MAVARVVASVTVSLLLLMLKWRGARCEQLESDGCVNSFQQLERSIISRDSNMDSLMDAFYPPNRPESIAVNVYYSYEHDGVTSYEHAYAFRWAASIVFELIRPDLLRRLSLYLHHGHTTTAKITIDPLCDIDLETKHSMTSYEICSGQGDPSDPVLLLNKLTTHVSILLNIACIMSPSIISMFSLCS